MVTEQEQFDRLFGHMLGHQAAEIAAIGIRSGLFAAISDQPGATSDELASAADFDAGYVSTWTRGAFAHGLIDHTDGDGFALAPHIGRLLLDPTAPSYLGGSLRLEAAFDEDYRRFPELMATGQTWPRSDHHPEVLQALADATAPDGTMLVEHVLPQLPSVVERLRHGGAMLEVGAGAGGHTLGYARAFPSCEIVALEFDEPSVMLARERLDEAGMTDRVEIRHGDANELAEQDRYDLATLNLVLHETGGETSWRNVLRRTFDALRIGGGILVSELPYPDDLGDYRTNPIHRDLAGVQLHETVVGCGAITQGQLLNLVDDAGFTDVGVAEQPRTSRHVVIGTKPQR